MKNLTAYALLAGLLAFGGGVAAAADPTGTWSTDAGKVTVKVSKCGGGLCGRIVAMKIPNTKEGKPKTDKHNPNPSLRKRPLIGLTVMNGMKPTGTNKWAGSIYNADDGKTYKATMTMAGNAMNVRGCVLVFCSTKKFVKVN